MNTFDIFIAYIAWKGNGKTRPVLVLEQQGDVIYVFTITTQYENKSEYVRARYFKIIDWQQAGLNSPSYIDTNTIRDLPYAAINGRMPIGKLTAADEQRLIEFIGQ
ncbi:MAG: hypothetical protein LBR85_01405 [Oscillospiraceae bacterium]|jgi:hypothetical protein|nr:hypothetical protein [Oscillospiraceae bacterium]